jgi:hypothetical protein
VFWHASKRGYKNATWWGVGVFLLGALFLPLYALRVLMGRRR